MQTLSTDYLHYNKATRTFSTELSDIPTRFVPSNVVYIKNPKSGVTKAYKFTHKDTDASNEDVYGWHYHNIETNTDLLIIND